ncbi:hypothetical protein FIBSPDRAFT_33620 [Athelia psychrophila]|uniref:Uncharacterized protein n=1 Tax=Athelia psychrophila TaxID=1759441 RepID=A0A166FUB8_9AGAM|nr:hypothetical protein FIBSPDRAFT_33620 [Fibularhizoctonia sp. CBS 109695]
MVQDLSNRARASPCSPCWKSPSPTSPWAWARVISKFFGSFFAIPQSAYSFFAGHLPCCFLLFLALLLHVSAGGVSGASFPYSLASPPGGLR